MPQPHEIAVSIDPVSDNNRGMLRGVVDYVSEQGDLRVYKVGAVPYMSLAKLRDWRGAGAVCIAETTAQLKQLVALDIPKVSVSLHQQPPRGLPTVHSDNRAIGRLAAEHLVELGLKRFAFVGYLGWRHNVVRMDGFRRALAAHGLECEVVEVQFAHGRRARTWTANLNRAALVRKLKTLCYPVGLFAAHDEFAHDVVEALRDAELQVPYDAAVVGVNNYRLICETSFPPLSSIAQAAHEIGYRAAQLLHDMIEKRRKPPRRPILIPPGRLVARRSSDYSAVDDEIVVEAMNFIRDHCSAPITAEDVVEHSPVSRRTLDKRFLSAIGHAAAEEIRLARLKKARDLLASTDMQVTMIGVTCGYDSSSGFARAFREATGMTPLEYRRHIQPASSTIRET